MSASTTVCVFDPTPYCTTGVCNPAVEFPILRLPAELTAY